ncbi:hypothetical protein GEMRC1_009141 [Eukaryota sp. GEM-RC1]
MMISYSFPSVTPLSLFFPLKTSLLHYFPSTHLTFLLPIATLSDGNVLAGISSGNCYCFWNISPSSPTVDPFSVILVPPVTADPGSCLSIAYLSPPSDHWLPECIVASYSTGIIALFAKSPEDNLSLSPLTCLIVFRLSPAISSRSKPSTSHLSLSQLSVLCNCNESFILSGVSNGNGQDLVLIYEISSRANTTSLVNKNHDELMICWAHDDYEFNFFNLAVSCLTSRSYPIIHSSILLSTPSFEPTKGEDLCIVLLTDSTRPECLYLSRSDCRSSRNHTAVLHVEISKNTRVETCF